MRNHQKGKVDFVGLGWVCNNAMLELASIKNAMMIKIANNKKDFK